MVKALRSLFVEPSVLAATGRYPLGQNPSIYDEDALKECEAPQGMQEIWAAYREPHFARSCIVCTNVAESGVTIPSVGLVISSGVQRRVSTNIRTGSTVNALQTLSKAQLLQQLGHAGRTDQGVHITMMSHDQYISQLRSTDLAQLEESDLSPTILRSLVAGRSFARLPFLCPPHPVVQARAKEKMFLHGVLDSKGVSRIGTTTNTSSPQRSLHGCQTSLGADVISSLAARFFSLKSVANVHSSVQEALWIWEATHTRAGWSVGCNV